MLLMSSALSELLIYAIVVLMVGHTLYLRKRKRWLLFEPINTFWAGCLVIYVLQPINHESILRSWHGEGTLEATLFWILLGLAAVVLGYESPLGVRWSKYIPVFPREISTGLLFVLGAINIALGCLSYSWMFESAGGVEAWLAVGRGGTKWVGEGSVSGYAASLEPCMSLGILLWFAAIMRRRVPPVIALAVFVLVLLEWYWFLYLGTRSRVIAWTMGTMAVYYLSKRKSPNLLIAVFAFCSLLVITKVQAEYRNQFTNLSLNLDQIDWDEFESNANASDEERVGTKLGVSGGIEFNCTMAVVELAGKSVDYTYGYGYLEFFTRPIPRAFWPDKVYPLMEAQQQIFREGKLTGTTAPGTDLLAGPALGFVGTWYLVGGPLALTVMGFFTGAGFRALRFVYVRDPRSVGNILMYLWIVGMGFGEAVATPLLFIMSLHTSVLPLLLLFLFQKILDGKKS